jgi:hypothetical protein
MAHKKNSRKSKPNKNNTSSVENAVIVSGEDARVVLYSFPGDHTTDAPPPRGGIFHPVRKFIKNRAFEDATEKNELKSLLEKLEQEVYRESFPDLYKLKRWLRYVNEMAPDVFEVILLLAAKYPRHEIEAVFASVAREIKEEKGSPRDSS